MIIRLLVGRDQCLSQFLCLGKDLHARHVSVQVRGIGVSLCDLVEAADEILNLFLGGESHDSDVSVHRGVAVLNDTEQS